MISNPNDQFVLDRVVLPAIHSDDTPSGRYYVTPSGNRYPSVTTFLSRFTDSSWLESWKERVGEDRANRVSTQAKRRGTAVHAILEKILLNDRFYMRGQMPNNLIMAESIANVLRARARVIKGIEIGVWSDKMKIAGRADCLGTFDDILSIIDFKTAKNFKNEEDIEGYFLQTTLYAMMVEELLGLSVPQIVILIGVDFENAQVFTKQKDLFLPKIKNMVLNTR